MKNQLRNIALAGALMMAGSAVAQETLAPAWTQVVPCSAPAGNVRFGMGYQGKIYFQDKGAKAIVVADGKNYENYVQDDRLTGTGITIDEAGNIIANVDFPNKPSGYKFLLIDTEKNITELDFSEEFEDADRTDFMGRTLGNVMSEEGGVFYICPNAQTVVYAASIVKGEINYDEFGFAASDPVPANNTSTVAIPRFGSMAEMYQAVEDGVVASASDAFLYRNRSDKKIQWFNQVDDQPVFSTWLTVPDNFTTYGFDAFELMGKQYVVVNIGTSHTQNFQVWCVTDNERVAVSSLPEKLGPSAQLQYNVEKVSDTKVNIYAVVYEGTNVHCSMTEFEVPGAPKNEIYFDNTNTQWDNVYAYIWNGAGAVYAEWPGVLLSDPVNNVYTFEVPTSDNYENVIFNNGAGSKTDDLVIEIGKTYEGPKSIVMDSEMYVMGNLPGHSWDPSYKGAGMTTVSAGVYEINEVEITNANGGYGYFGFTSKPDSNWNVVNANRYGATSGDKLIAKGTTDTIVKGENSWKIVAGVYKMTLNTVAMTLTVSDPSGVEVVYEVEAAPVYFNLQGVEVANPTNGLYIVKQGNKVSKVMVK